MSDSQKEKRLGPQGPRPVMECKVRNDSIVLGNFSKNCFDQKQPQQNKKNK